MAGGRMRLSARATGKKAKTVKSIVKQVQTQKSDVQVLAKAVTKLQKQNRVECEYLNYGYGESSIPMVSPFYQIALSRPSTWSAIFGSGTNDAEANRIIHKKFQLEGRISLENLTNNEENTVNFTMFLVTLHDEASDILNTTNGNLTISNNNHYYQQNGITYLNPKVFKVIKRKRFTLTNFGGSLDIAGAQSQFGADKRFWFKIPVNKTIINHTGDWRQLPQVRDPSKSYHLLIFNDNSSLDGENPTMDLSVLHTLKTVA